MKINFHPNGIPEKNREIIRETKAFSDFLYKKDKQVIIFPELLAQRF